MKVLNYKALVFILGLTASSLAVAEVFATYEVGKDGITLMTQQCPGDASGTLRWAISKFGSRLKEGCYTINNRGNPVVKWDDGKIQELDGNLFQLDPSQAVVKKEIVVPLSRTPEQSAKTASPSFDCVKARSDAEKLICGDDQLSNLDNELSRIYKEAKLKAVDAAAFRKQTEAEWRWRESNCHTKECLLEWYAKRKGQLNKVVVANK